jgi:hypothetical protein
LRTFFALSSACTVKNNPRLAAAYSSIDIRFSHQNVPPTLNCGPCSSFCTVLLHPAQWRGDIRQSASMIDKVVCLAELRAVQVFEEPFTFFSVLFGTLAVGSTFGVAYAYIREKRRH